MSRPFCLDMSGNRSIWACYPTSPSSLSEHQAPYLYIDLFGHHPVWTSVYLDIRLSDLDFDRDAWLLDHRIRSDRRNVRYRAIRIRIYLGIGLSGWRSICRSILLSEHRAIWTSGYLFFLKGIFKRSWHRLSGHQYAWPLVRVMGSDHRCTYRARYILIQMARYLTFLQSHLIRWSNNQASRWPYRLMSR